MAADRPCAFCELVLPAAQLRDAFGLEFCDACAVGLAEDALRTRGHAIVTRTWTTRVRTHDDAYVVHHLALDASPRDLLEISVSFTRERWSHKLLKLIKQELQVGDRLFDDLVYIDTREKPRVLALLHQPGTQAALIDLVARFDLIELRRGELRIRHASSEPIDLNDGIVSACALLVHLERIGRAHR